MMSLPMLEVLIIHKTLKLKFKNMSKTIIQIKTYSCQVCGYAQDFEPTAENMVKHFPELRGMANECPACALGQTDLKDAEGNKIKAKRNQSLIKETDPKKKTTITIIGEEEIDTMVKRDGTMMSLEAADEMDLKDKKIGKRENLTKTEKDKIKTKIQIDIAKFNLLKD